MTYPNRVRLSKLSLGLMVALAAAPVFAQSTSAGVGGQVVGADGQPVAGAEVTITHVESGTVSRAVTDASGRYNARGLRVGGPYTIVVNKAGAGTDTEDNVYLSLNQVNTINAQLNNSVTTLDSVVAVGVAGSSVFSATKMGSGTSVDQNTLKALPSIGGNIQDYMRLDPRVAFVDRASGTISAGGQNPRFNSINIDGVSASDTFGLEGNNMPTKRQPVSMEAIEALDINLSNYDVTIAGAAGANVNAVTKSGTNEFHGSLYGNMRDGDWFGKNPLAYGVTSGTRADFTGFEKEATYGATFGGPIVKDRLFFFANYEKYKQEAPSTDLSSTALGKTTTGHITEADVALAKQIASSKYGIEAGELSSDANTVLEEYALKLDWNISDDHRASFRYSKLDQSKLRINGMSSSAVSLSSYWYQHNKSVESYVAQVFSDWSDNFSTEFKASYRDYSAVRDYPTNAPSIQIYFAGSATSVGGDSLYLGTEINSQNNILLTKTWDYYGAGTLTLGDHDIKFGAQYSSNDIYNYYGRQTFGAYTFWAGAADADGNHPLTAFNDGTWTTYNYRAAIEPGLYGSIPAQYEATNLALFVQDTWYATPNLTLTFGLRGDRPDASPAPPYNELAYQVFGYDNTRIYSGDFLLQPRLGFNYTFDSERPMQLRGGVGLFQGDAPQVWVSNVYSNNGYNYITTTATAYRADLPFNPDGNDQTELGCTPYPNTASNCKMTVNFTAPDFKLPSVWKANLAFEHELPWYGIVGSAELLLTDVNNGLFYHRLNLGSGFVGPDGRTLYWNPAKTGKAWSSSDGQYGGDARFTAIDVIDNTSKGKSQQLTFSLNKPFDKGSDWSWSLAYTYTNATEVQGLTSSVASSSYSNTYAFNVGEDVASNARYAIKDRFSAALNWKHKFFGDYETRAGLVYEGRSGRPFSYVYYNDANGDGVSYNDLLYIPAGRGDVLFGTLTSAGVYTANPTAENAFFAWLEKHPEVAAYAGSYAPANAFRTGFVNTFDLRLSQELPGFAQGHKSQIWVDIQNVGNMLNKDWGRIYDYGFYADASTAGLLGIYNGKYVYNYTYTSDPTVANNDGDGFNVGVSQWSVQVGFKYEF
ncbi:MAG: TonB-dependent receptor [Thermomonas sp.]|uniref:TonB-dependent receptor n=1 Tax=Thermomonas sp. TaxID=1971895 RepID=UPI0039E565F5